MLSNSREEGPEIVHRLEKCREEKTAVKDRWLRKTGMIEGPEIEE